MEFIDHSYRPYAGIGSRKGLSTFDISRMVEIGRKLAELNWTLRSGHASGSDQAFERGCDQVGGLKEIFLPYPRFEGSTAKFHPTTDEMMELAGRYYRKSARKGPWDKASDNPNWRGLSDRYKPYHARNGCQIYGQNLDHRVDTVVCWTPNGAITGGTGQALRLVDEFLESGEVIVYNLGSDALMNMDAAEIVDHIVNRTYPNSRQMSLF